MIVESIDLKHVGPFVASARIGPLTSGLNVFGANNETGKTTVVRALTRVLFDKHTCRSEEIKGLQPVGTSLAPTVVVIFENGGIRFRVAKTFLEAPQSQLSQWANDQWQLIAEGDKADNRLQEVLHSEQPGRGATKPEHWGMFAYLWAQQGEPVVWPEWGGETGQDIRSRLVKVELDPLIEHLRKALAEEYGTLFTDQGRTKARGPLGVAEEEKARLGIQLEEVHQKAKELEESQTRFQAVAEEVTTLEQEAEEKQKAAEETSGRAREVEMLLQELETRKREFDAAQGKLHAIEDDIRLINQAQETMKDIEAQRKESLDLLGKVSKREATLAREHMKAHTTLNREQENSATMQKQLDRVQGILKYRRAAQELKPLRLQSEQASARVKEIDGLESQRSSIPPVSTQKIDNLGALDQDIRQVEGKLEVIGLSVELRPDTAQLVDVTESGKTKKLALRPGQTETLKSGQALRLRLHSWGRIQVRSGATEVEQLQKEGREKRRELTEALSKLGVKTVAEAKSLSEIRRDLDAKIREAQRDLKRSLGEFADIRELQSEMNQRAAVVKALEEALRPSRKERSEPTAAIDGEEERLKVEMKASDRRIRQLTRDATNLGDELTSCRRQKHDVETELARQQERHNSAQEQIRHTQSQYSAGIGKAKVEAQQGFAEAEARVSAMQSKLPPDARMMHERNRRAARAAEEAAQDLRQKKEERDRLTGRLETLGAEGIFSKETELLERIDDKRRESEAARRRGWAARLLYDLIERRKQAATRAVLAPLQEQLSTTFADLTGQRTRKVFLDESLAVRGIGRTETEMHPFKLLSQGAKEQLVLSLRLAVAATTAEHGRQLLILDDVLANTDSVRQQRLLDLLQSAAESLQILVLTCHAERYRGVGKTIDVTYPRDASAVS
jgi:DNA repair exonuclease SbcCD ATPase subunit